MTADQVAAECQLSRETVTNHLIRLVKDGKAQWAHPPNGPDGRMVPRIYSQMPRPENAGRQAAIERGMATERQVLDAFTGRHAAFEIAEQTGISRKTVQRVFAKLAENGIIVESGQTFNSRGMPVKTWVKT